MYPFQDEDYSDDFFPYRLDPFNIERGTKQLPSNIQHLEIGFKESARYQVSLIFPHLTEIISLPKLTLYDISVQELDEIG